MCTVWVPERLLRQLCFEPGQAYKHIKDIEHEKNGEILVPFRDLIMDIDQRDNNLHHRNLRIEGIISCNMLPVWTIDTQCKEQTVYTTDANTQQLFQRLVEMDNSSGLLVRNKTSYTGLDEKRVTSSWSIFYITVESGAIVVKHRNLVDRGKGNHDLIIQDLEKLQTIDVEGLDLPNTPIIIDSIDMFLTSSLGKDQSQFEGPRIAVSSRSSSAVFDKVLNKRTNQVRMNSVRGLPTPVTISSPSMMTTAPGAVSNMDKSLERLIMGEMKMSGLDQSTNSKEQAEMLDIVMRSIKFKFRNEINDDHNASISLLDIDKVFAVIDDMFKILV